MKQIFAACFALFSLLAARSVGAYANDEVTGLNDTANRREMGVVPIIGGDSDFGVAVGGIASIAQFEANAIPYAWRLELSALASFKHDDSGFNNPYQDYYIQATLPALFTNQMRLTMRVAYTKYTLLQYYGLGNASQAPKPWSQYPANSPEYFQARDYSTYGLVYPHATTEILYKLGDVVRLRLAGDYFYENATVHPGSKLDQDFNSANKDISDVLYGRGKYSVGLFTAGLVFDTRDNETAPVKGTYDTIAVRFSPGQLAKTAYTFGGLYVAVRNYVPIYQRYLSLAIRLAGDALVGHVPYFMLAESEDGYAVGGVKGVRGVPAQRYYGRLKTYGNIELRSEFVSFEAFDQEVRMGLVAFYDAGRVWADYKRDPMLDGTGVGLKYGIGGGFRMQMGETFLLRLDGAWSPDATPVAVYFNVGQAF